MKQHETRADAEGGRGTEDNHRERFGLGVEMIKLARDLRFNRQLVPVAVTLAGSLLANMAVGFAVGVAVHYLLLGKEHRHADTQR